MQDITEWESCIPDLNPDAYDWKEMAEKDMETVYSYSNPDETVYSLWIHDGYVADLTNLMGFSEALMALYEETGSGICFFDRICDFYCGILERTLDLYKPDVFHMFDTYAGSANAFYSIDTYKELVLPFHMREARIAHEHGLPSGKSISGEGDGPPRRGNFCLYL